MNGAYVAEIERIAASPEFYPAALDIDRNLIHFVRLDRGAYRNAAFLAAGAMRAGAGARAFGLDDLLFYSQHVPTQPRPSHYILISAFCCSTLLARYLDDVDGCLVLREPAILGQLAMLRHGAAGRRLDALRWNDAAALGIRLLTRCFPGDENVIIKAADVCNSIGPTLLANDPRSKAVLLGVDLRTFILQVLKSEPRRKWLRARARGWSGGVSAFPELASVDPTALDDATASAYVWLVTAVFWAELRAKTYPGRLLIMDGSQVSDSPLQALASVARFFELPLHPGRAQEIVTSPSASRHAKDQSRSYDSDSRRRELMDADQCFRDEVNHAVTWAGGIYERLGLGSVDVSGTLQLSPA